MSVLSCNGISLSYGTDTILDDISFSVNAGTKLGVVGVNGAGKSTLLKIICGSVSPDKGSVAIANGIRLGSTEQYSDAYFKSKTVSEVALASFSDLVKMEAELAELEALLNEGNTSVVQRYSSLHERFEILGGFNYKAKALSLIKRFGFSENSLNAPAQSLSGGQKMRLSLAALLLSEPDIILLDEPTNHLDISTVQWLEEQIRSSRATFLIVSHDRYFLDKTTSHTLEIENTHAVLYKGAYSEFKEKKKKLLEDSAKHYQLQQREIARLEAFIENQRKWNRERNIIAAESRMKAIARMDKLEKPDAPQQAISIDIHSSIKSSTDVLSVRNLSKAFGGKTLFKNLSVEIKKGDRLFVIGGNGTGKSTFLKIVTGTLSSDFGTVELGYNQKPGYYDQEQMLLNNSLDVITELWNAYPTMTQTELRGALARYGFRGDDVFKSVANLSGGEKARLSIAKLVLSGSSFLILDEPTNYLDIRSKEVLEEALRNYAGTLLCVSHDRYFISSLATRLLEVGSDNPNGFRVFDCDYASYIQHQTLDEPELKRTHTQTESAKSFNEAKKEKSDKKKLERRKAFLESEIARLEKETADTDALITANSSDYIALQELEEKRNTLNEQLLKYMDELISYLD